MKKCGMAAVLVVLGLMGVARGAVISFDLLSHGGYSSTVATLSSAETVIFQQANGAFPTLVSMDYTVTTATLGGVGTYSNGVDSFTYSFTFTTDVLVDGSSGTENAHAAWTFVSGTGAFNDVVSGSGVLGTNFNVAFGSSQTVFSGVLDRVTPEPVLAGLLAPGVVLLGRRRR